MCNWDYSDANVQKEEKKDKRKSKKEKKKEKREREREKKRLKKDKKGKRKGGRDKSTSKPCLVAVCCVEVTDVGRLNRKAIVGAQDRMHEDRDAASIFCLYRIFLFSFIGRHRMDY